MIDLHTHTSYSDGTSSVIELLENAEKKEISVLSITDHNTAMAYEELENLDVKKYYSGRIIPGIELNTKILGVPIEILGYGIDYKIINEILKDVYISAEKRNVIEVQRLSEKCLSAGIKIDKNSLDNFDGKSFASKFIQNEINKYPENANIISEDALADTKVFYRKYMSNPEGILYVEMDDLVPDFETASNVIKQSGGLVFLPHIFEYREKSEKILEFILKNHRIDGIECFYTTFSREQKEFLTSLCKDKGLYMSGGSDYHGLNKPNVELGTGFGDLLVEESVIKDWYKNTVVLPY